MSDQTTPSQPAASRINAWAILALPYAVRLALLAWYAALVMQDKGWWAVPLLVLFALSWGVGKAVKP